MISKEPNNDQFFTFCKALNQVKFFVLNVYAEILWQQSEAVCTKCVQTSVICSTFSCGLFFFPKILMTKSI